MQTYERSLPGALNGRKKRQHQHNTTTLMKHPSALCTPLVCPGQGQHCPGFSPYLKKDQNSSTSLCVKGSQPKLLLATTTYCHWLHAGFPGPEHGHLILNKCARQYI